MNDSVSAEIYHRLIDEIDNKRLYESVKRVKAACDFLSATRSRITPTSVGHYCADRWGGPKSQSIRNANTTLFAYLKARSAEQILPQAKKIGNFEPVVQDENIRAYVNLLKAERDEAIREKNRIIVGLRKIPGIPIDDLIRNGGLTAIGPATQAVSKQISTELQSALEKLVNQEVLASVGLELYRHRIRNSLTNKVLLEKSGVEAILSLIASNTCETDK